MISIFYMLIQLLNETKLPFKSNKLLKMIMNKTAIDEEKLYSKFKEVKVATSL